jgi:hypothetical protein
VESKKINLTLECESQIQDEAADMMIRPINPSRTFKGGMIADKKVRYKFTRSIVESPLQINTSSPSPEPLAFNPDIL